MRDCGLYDVCRMNIDICHDFSALQRDWRQDKASEKYMEPNSESIPANAFCSEIHLLVEQSSIQVDDHEASCLRLNSHPDLLTRLQRSQLGCNNLLVDALL